MYILLIMEGKNYYNIYKKFQVHSSNICWIRGKNIAR